MSIKELYEKKQELEKKRQQLEAELKVVKAELFLQKKAERPMTTYNRVILSEGQEFYAIGYRNPRVYKPGEWSVQFTTSETRARQEIEIMQRRGGGETRLWRLRLKEEGQ